MKKFSFCEKVIELYRATAIALCDKEHEDQRQDVIYEVCRTVTGEVFEHVIFGCGLVDLDSAEDYIEYAEDNGADFEALAEEHHINIIDEDFAK